jgi:hypothetical protein
LITHYGNQQYYGLSTDTKPLATDTAINATFGELDTGDQYINTGTAWVLQVGAGGGLSAGGQISFNGTAVQTVFNIPHGLSQTPDFISVQPASADAFGSFTRTKDATNIVITYQIPPPLGSSNVTFQWGAGFVSEDIAIGLSSSSTTTFTNKTIDFDLNTIKLPFCSVVVYKAGTTYKAKNMVTGDTLATTSTTDASTVINAAINNIPGAAARGYGGIVFISAGDYDCKTLIDLNIDTTTYHAVQLVGEGIGTNLTFTPASALTNGIRLRMANARLSNMRVYGNANVTNIIQAIGKGSGFTRHDYGVLDHMRIDGATAIAQGTTSITATAGQKGLLIEGTAANLAEFFWKIHNCDFRGCDIGIHAYNQYSTSTQQVNNTFYSCATGVKISSGQHNIDNMWVQGDTGEGVYGIWLSSEGSGHGNNINIDNLHTELTKTGVLCAGIYIDGTVTNMKLGNIRQTFNDGELLRHVVYDVTTTSRTNLDFETYATPRLPGAMTKVGSVSGCSPFSSGDGEFAGNARESVTGTFSSAAAIDGRYRMLSTGATINTVASAYTATNTLQRRFFPKLQTMIFNQDTTALRIFVGFVDTYADATTSADPLNAKTGAGLWIDTAVSADWKFMHNDGIGASIVDPLSTPQAINSSATHRLRVWARDSATAHFACRYDNITTSATSEIPATTDDLGWMISIENTAGANKRLWVYWTELSTTI